MRAYSIFDDYSAEAIDMLNRVGVDVAVHPLGTPRPNDAEMEAILEAFDIVIIGTSQKLSEGLLSKVTAHKILATASVGTDHIQIPASKQDLFTVINTPSANAQSVAEYTVGCALSCVKRMREGAVLYAQGKDNKQLSRKPEDLCGKTIGVVGAGNISVKIMEYAHFFGMKVLCFTAHPTKHMELLDKGVRFVGLEELAASSDVVSVNLPNNIDTFHIIDADFVARLKENCIFISVSRLATVDWKALFQKANAHKNFYVCLDIDLDGDVCECIDEKANIQITPHIAGGTIETRKRMFMELAKKISEVIK